jgi:hypothetical protein
LHGRELLGVLARKVFRFGDVVSQVE